MAYTVLGQWMRLLRAIMCSGTWCLCTAVSHSWNFWQIWENLNFTEKLYSDMTTPIWSMGNIVIFSSLQVKCKFLCHPPPPEKKRKKQEMKEEKEKNPHISLHSTWMPYTKISMWDWILIPKLLFALNVLWASDGINRTLGYQVKLCHFVWLFILFFRTVYGFKKCKISLKNAQ